MITRINIKEQKLRANPIQFFISIIKWLKSLLRGKKKKVWRNDKNQISWTPSKQSDWLSISSPCYFVSMSKSIYSTSSILLLVEDLLNGVYREKFIYKKNKKFWYEYERNFSTQITSPLVLLQLLFYPLCFIFRQSISMLLTVSKTKNNISRKSP